uniref:Uncharacterized protein n=1 Tax=viral metagenome TaxID=1070528 RepID=A0A6C0HWM3_9ZZZZ
MNSVDLYKLKNDTKCVFLSENIISSILDTFSKSNIKVIKCAKKQVSAIKTNKVQAKKDLNENKIIMIMNKISENNINELIGEYLCNVFVDTEEKYNVIMTEIFNKMLKDIKFVENYIKFALKIFIIEKKRLNLYPEEFIDLIKLTVSIGTEEERCACYTLMKVLIKYEFFNKDIIKFISNIVLSNNDKLKYIDIYNWFSGIDISEYREAILNIIKKCNSENMNREEILLESLFEKSINNELVEETLDIISNHNQINTLINNIIEEYDFLKSIDEVIEFIQVECDNINNKNLFCKEVINFYISKDINIGLELIDELIKKKSLFKSNISKGLVLYLGENNNNTSIHNNTKIIQILKYLKNNNITKNIEHIFKRFRVKLFYEN